MPNNYTPTVNDYFDALRFMLITANAHHRVMNAFRELRNAYNNSNAKPAQSPNPSFEALVKFAARLESDNQKLQGENEKLARSLNALGRRYQQLTEAATKQANDVDQILGKALAYPRYVDDRSQFPFATESDGVYTGSKTVEELATEAAATIDALCDDIKVTVVKESIRAEAEKRMQPSFVFLTLGNLVSAESNDGFVELTADQACGNCGRKGRADPDMISLPLDEI